MQKRDEKREGRGGGNIVSRTSSQEQEKAPERTLNRNFDEAGKRAIIRDEVKNLKLVPAEAAKQKPLSVEQEIAKEVRRKTGPKDLENSKLVDEAGMLHRNPGALFTAMKDLTNFMDYGTVEYHGTRLVAYAMKYPTEFLARIKEAEEGAGPDARTLKAFINNEALPVVSINGRNYNVSYSSLVNVAKLARSREEKKRTGETREAKG